MEIIANNYMVVPINRGEKSIQGAKRQPIHDARFGTLKNIIWEHTVAASTTFLFDGQSETLKQTGNEAGFFSKLLKEKYGLPLQVVFLSKDFTDPLNESKDNPSMHYKKELINYLVVINKFG
jgi:hypothetical protein